MSLKISFEFDVDFMELPKYPSLENCEKCGFRCVKFCIKEDMLLCGHGTNGYFVVNRVKEV